VSGIAWLGAVFAASLIGSLHCAAMCGGFIGCLAGTAGRGRGARLHAAYHLGRCAGYLALGAAAGLVGAGIDRAGWLAGMRGAAPILCGALVALAALAALARALGARIPAPAWRGPAHQIAALLARLRERGPWLRGGALGLLTALLPCGWLWAFVATAAGTGSAAGGAATIAAFWLGTVPILLGIGLGAARLLAPVRARLPLVTAALLLAVGIGTAAGWGPLPPRREPVARAAGELPALPDVAPCCHE
jgi:sulfite exporter TauE/SafE